MTSFGLYLLVGMLTAMGVFAFGIRVARASVDDVESAIMHSVLIVVMAACAVILWPLYLVVGITWKLVMPS